MQPTTNNKNYIIGIVLLIIIVIAIVVFTGHKGGEYTDTNATTTATTTDMTGTSGSHTTTSTHTSVPAATTGSIDSSNTVGNAPAPASIPSSNPVPTNPAPAHTTSVSYTNYGFSPSSVTINRGDGIVFTNESASFMWVVSHPNEQYPKEYPGFNEGTQVSNGGKYTITFTEPGTYQYYNQNNVGSVGLVIVQ